MLERKYEVISETGIHARVATSLIAEANHFKCQIILNYDENKIDFKSILGVMSLGMYQGEKFSLIFDGEDENEAMQAVCSLLDSLKTCKEI